MVDSSTRDALKAANRQAKALEEGTKALFRIARALEALVAQGASGQAEEYGTAESDTDLTDEHVRVLVGQYAGELGVVRYQFPDGYIRVEFEDGSDDVYATHDVEQT